MQALFEEIGLDVFAGISVPSADPLAGQRVGAPAQTLPSPSLSPQDYDSAKPPRFSSFFASLSLVYNRSQPDPPQFLSGSCSPRMENPSDLVF